MTLALLQPLCWSLMTRITLAKTKDSTLHEQGVPEVELVDPEEEDKEKCASIYSGLLS